MGLHLSEEVPLTSPQKKILPLVRCKLISNQIETLDFTLKKQSIEPAREPKTAINARKRQSNMTCTSNSKDPYQRKVLEEAGSLPICKEEYLCPVYDKFDQQQTLHCE
jgi:hypothetical protein